MVTHYYRIYHTTQYLIRNIDSDQENGKLEGASRSKGLECGCRRKCYYCIVRGGGEGGGT